MPFENYFFLEKAFWDFFSRGRPFEIYFFLEVASKFFSFSRKVFWDLFFLGEGLLRFIFSWGRPFEIYFFPGEGPPEYFFLDFLQAHPQIINGRPLKINRPWPYGHDQLPGFSQSIPRIIEDDDNSYLYQDSMIYTCGSFLFVFSAVVLVYFRLVTGR